MRRGLRRTTRSCLENRDCERIGDCRQAPAWLRGARMVTSIEAEEGRRWAEARKALTGGDPVIPPGEHDTTSLTGSRPSSWLLERCERDYLDRMTEKLNLP